MVRMITAFALALLATKSVVTGKPVAVARHGGTDIKRSGYQVVCPDNFIGANGLTADFCEDYCKCSFQGDLLITPGTGCTGIIADECIQQGSCACAGPGLGWPTRPAVDPRAKGYPYLNPAGTGLKKRDLQCTVNATASTVYTTVFTKVTITKYIGATTTVTTDGTALGNHTTLTTSTTPVSSGVEVSSLVTAPGLSTTSGPAIVSDIEKPPRGRLAVFAFAITPVTRPIASSAVSAVEEPPKWTRTRDPALVGTNEPPLVIEPPHIFSNPGTTQPWTRTADPALTGTDAPPVTIEPPHEFTNPKVVFPQVAPDVGTGNPKTSRPTLVVGEAPQFFEN